MGSVIPRKNAKGETRYTAQIRIKREGLQPYSESRTFSKKSLATTWLSKREAEIELDPSILNPDLAIKNNMTLGQAFEKYLDEVTGFGRSKRNGILLLTKFPFAKLKMSKATRSDFADHVNMRRKGTAEYKAIMPSTALQDLQYTKVVMEHAELVWGEVVNVRELEHAMKGLRKSRTIGKGRHRDRLPTTEELITLTNHFRDTWERGRTNYPMHLIMWYAIYSCRRQNEICNLLLSDYNEEQGHWLVRNLKNPNGSDGNNKAALIAEHTKSIIDLLRDPETRKRMGAAPGEDRMLPLDNTAIRTYFSDACRMVGIKNLRFHDLRHEGATRLAEQGKTIPQIQQVTLHLSWSSLERYVNISHRGKVLEYEETL
ncbi:site-specific integrase [Aquirhabdus parva]|uniref:Site-specific integrase n=1 Tax=Aquirhabdus parva TaxID=2283318 RepID=A0A345P2D4_9GAMM|nr:tyrosine-type recombinase/integrase [Aquirhabdus parva]AXI01443.1 site-specific integrase [Aquirhabdus parva]AXI04389.1 site-specific integrase [Aquirhabdus parva]